jgi:hypothetical protein
MPMKRLAWLVPSLIATTALVASCGGKPPGKADLAQACMQRMGGVQEKCDCYVASIEKALSPADFSQLAKGAREYEGYSGDWLPSNVSRIPTISTALHQATLSCLTST